MNSSSSSSSSPPFPNSLFIAGLQVLENEAILNDDKRREWAFRKARNAIKEYNDVIPNGLAAKSLPGISDGIANRLDNMLRHFNETGEFPTPTPAAATPRAPARAAPRPPPPPELPLPLKPQPSGLRDEFGDIDEDPNKGAPVVARKGKRSGPYIPQKRSGGYAILIALLEAKQEPGYPGFLTQDEIMARGQKYCNALFVDPRSRWTAWNSAGTLKDKGLLLVSGKTKYFLSEEGEKLAKDLLEASINDDEHDTNKATPPKAPAKLPPKTASLPLLPAPASSPPEKKQAGVKRTQSEQVLPNPKKAKAELGPEAAKSVEPKGAQNTNSQPGVKPAPYPTTAPVSSSVSPSSLDDKPAPKRAIRSPTPDTEEEDDDDPAPPPSVQSTAPGLHDPPFLFSYLDSENRQVTSKDDAEVVVDGGQVLFKLEFMSPQTQHPTSNKIFLKTRHPLRSENLIGYIRDFDAVEKSSHQFPPIVAVKPASFFLPTEPSRSSAREPAPAPKESAPATGAKHHLVSFEPKSFEVILLVDSREIRAKDDREFLQKGFERNEIKCETRALAVGDFLWIARSNETGEEIVLSYIVERKRIDDLANSIVDGRFKEQKFRLSTCGADEVIYMVEDKRALAPESLKLDPERMEAALMHTQIHNDFFVKQTDNIDDTVGYLSVVTFQIMNLYKKRRVLAIGGDQIPRRELDQLRARYHEETKTKHHLTYTLFDQMNTKGANLTQRDLFLKQLLQIRSVGVDKAVAITEVYPTLSRLLTAYDRLGSAKEKEALLAGIPCGPLKRKLGPQISKKLYELYCAEEY